MKTDRFVRVTVVCAASFSTIVFLNAASLRDALERALRLYADRPRLAAVQRRGMARDFSWTISAAAYEALYRESL